MNIGIDAKWYFNGHPSGKVVVENLVNNILLFDKENHFIIFLNKRDKGLEFPKINERVTIVYLPTITNALTNILILPFYTKKYKVEACLYQNYAALWGAKRRINYVHDALWFDYPTFFSIWERMYFNPMKFLSRKADKVITISQSERERMIKHGFAKPNNIYAIHHGVQEIKKNIPDSNEQLNSKYKLPKKYILYLGRLNIRKNIQTLLRAMPLINEEAYLVIVGKNDHKSLDLNKLMTNLKISHRVIQTGYVPEEDIPFLYNRATLFCFPSFAEGFGLPPLEAMQYHTPVVVSNNTSLPEVCGEAAIYIDCKSPMDIAEKINRILDNENLQRELIEKGNKQVKKFSWEKTAKNVLKILKQP
ncbi:glycosyltransferase family 4 protein [Mangrovimonas sp. AS39]|uniref:glycosyltransferase family 4 protein n=1 Tax=Mangrovimonas futianensis TaxID=2895523 RepID=UPI001E3660E2|nr:glycosyltransferase family 1 protein [Mangrovimonas futianensis]MCF1190314.1 glycosyltransferase family 4 protein [Mangrovimonas futianensis]MCF1193933.1 glycosyltransferase family 4 protein [Mangrovimonas futianensis]MCF1420930.1 glycosyltransferase family 4 protein [Mangrovimonas futianensis]